MLELPVSATAYQTIGPFDQDSVPAGLLREHRTKPGVWGLLEVQEGQLRYHIPELGEEHILNHLQPGVIAPQQYHHLTINREVVFRITFYRAAGR